MGGRCRRRPPVWAQPPRREGTGRPEAEAAGCGAALPPAAQPRLRTQSCRRGLSNSQDVLLFQERATEHCPGRAWHQKGQREGGWGGSASWEPCAVLHWRTLTLTPHLTLRAAWGPHLGPEGQGYHRPSLTSAQETPPGTAQPVGTEGRGLRCPAGPTSAPEGFGTEDSPSATPSAPGCFFLPRTSGEKEGYCQGLMSAAGTGCPASQRRWSCGHVHRARHKAKGR